MASELIIKRTLLDADQMRRVIRRMAGELLERHNGAKDLVLVGIRTRGVPLAEKLAEEIETMEGVKVPLGVLDITLYRDDLSTVAPHPVVKETSFSVPIEGRPVVLCDALVDYGRPRSVELAVLVDRGWRELPIQADLVGLELTTTASEVVKVCFEATDDGVEVVELLDREPAR